LPCDEAICSHCESSIQFNNGSNKFDCPQCPNRHEMPIDGLPICKPLLEMLSIKPIKVSRGKVLDSLEKLLDDIHKKRNYIQLGISNSHDIVKEHFIGLRNKVELETEEAILKLNEQSTKLIEQPNKIEKNY